MPYHSLCCESQIERELLMEAFPGAEMAVLELRFPSESYQKQRVHKEQAANEVQAMTRRQETSVSVPQRTLSLLKCQKLCTRSTVGHRVSPGRGILGPALRVFALRYTESLVTWLSRFVTWYQIQQGYLALSSVTRGPAITA